MQEFNSVYIFSRLSLSLSLFSLYGLHWQPNAGTTVNSQILNEVSQCVESINRVKEGRWKATLTFYKPIIRGNSLSLSLEYI